MRHQFISEEQFAEMVKRRDVDPIEGVGSTNNCNQRSSRLVGKTGVTAVPKAKLLEGSSPYKSKWETAYASKLEQEKMAGLIRAWWYEPFSLWLPGKVRYKPDFMIQYPMGMERSLEVIEVKGWSRNKRDGMTRLKIAAALFPCFTWRMVYRTKGGGWSGEYI